MRTAHRYINAIMAADPDVIRKPTCLYIGARPVDGLNLVPELRRAGYLLTILEAWEPNVQRLKGELEDDETILHGDVRKWEPPHPFDLVMWWHGPEHVKPAELDPVVRKMTKWGKKVILGMPWGHQIQGAKDGNPHEPHVWDCEPEWFANRGYCTVTVGKKNILGGQIVATRINT